MNRITLVTIFVLCAMLCNTGCDKDSKINCPCFEIAEPESEEDFAGIETISFENFPQMDGSTSTSALNRMIACKLLNLRYEWLGGAGTEWEVQPYDVPEEYHDFFWASERIKISQTHGAFMNLIDGESDIILTHRTLSPDEKAHANAVGVTLIETSIALDAFVFIVNRNNPVKSLTVNQIQKIYTGQITNWSKVGGKNKNIQVLARPRNSGSEEVFRELVMNGLDPIDSSGPALINPMWMVLDMIMNIENSICYTFYNYKEIIARKPCYEVPVLAINGICPTESTVKNRTYPFISEVRVAIRSDLDRNSMAYKLYEWLQSENAKSTLIECGFIPK